jgi:ABC-type sugar transport system ATPase subunit
LAAAQALLEVHDVTKSFGAVAAVQGVSFPLYAGEAHALVGENGAGKSTIVKMLDSSSSRSRTATTTIAGAEGEKFMAGKLGEYTIGADGEIVLGPPTEFTAANIDQFNF